MIKIVKADTTSGNSYYCYQIAGHEFLFTEPVKTLHAYFYDRTAGKVSGEPQYEPQANLLTEHNSQCVYQGRAPFEHRMQDICCWRDGAYSQIDVSGIPVCQIDSENEIIYLLNKDSFDKQLNLEVVTGPASILLMAQSGTFCLHASAVATQVGSVLFIAESGTGKSTLSQHVGDSWNQLSDDISPLLSPLAGTDGVQLLTRFPQLKLANASVQSPLADSLSVDLIVRLGNRECDEISITPLQLKDSLLQIIRHTVAAKLFDAEQLKQHAAFALDVASKVPMVEINYPRDLEQLPALRQSIIDYLSA